MKALICPCITIAGLAIAACAAHAAEFHVAATGDDANPGTEDKPFATLEKARDAMRGTLHPRNGGTTTVFISGTFRLTQSLELNEKDSGTESAPVTWQAANGGKAILTGGIPIPSDLLRPVTDAATLGRLPDERDPSLRLFELRMTDIGQSELPHLKPAQGKKQHAASWPELFLDDQPLPLSTWPNGIGYTTGFKPSKVIESGTTAKPTASGASATANTATKATAVFTFNSPRTARWKNARDTFRADLWIGGHWFWDWSDDFVAVAGIDQDKTITMSRVPAYGIGKHVNLHVYNLVEEMDAPGEYAIEPAKNRILILLSDAQRKQKLILTCLGAPFVQIDRGQHIRFKGIRFGDTRADAVQLNQASHVTFRDCDFLRVGKSGMVANGTDLLVEDCLFSQMGSAGIIMDGGDRKTLTSGRNRVARCEFSDFSRIKRTYAPGVRLGGVGMTVENCLFHHSPHSAILFGGNEHLIRNNRIHTVLTETGDCGAIYGGRDWASHGTEISGNWIHDLGGEAGRWCNAIYLDDCLSGITVKNNFIDRVPLGTLIGGGRHNRITGNIFSRCQEAMHLDSRGIGWMKNHPCMDTLKARLAEMPVAQEPWASRYPMAKETLNNEPGKPVGTVITGNAVVACRNTWLKKQPAGVAVVEPNLEIADPAKLTISGDRVSVTGTGIDFAKPQVGRINPECP
jgi:hypothetical protein